MTPRLDKRMKTDLPTTTAAPFSRSLLARLRKPVILKDGDDGSMLLNRRWGSTGSGLATFFGSTFILGGWEMAGWIIYLLSQGDLLGALLRCLFFVPFAYVSLVFAKNSTSLQVSHGYLVQRRGPLLVPRRKRELRAMDIENVYRLTLKHHFNGKLDKITVDLLVRLTDGSTVELVEDLDEELAAQVERAIEDRLHIKDRPELNVIAEEHQTSDD